MLRRFTQKRVWQRMQQTNASWTFVSPASASRGCSAPWSRQKSNGSSRSPGQCHVRLAWRARKETKSSESLVGKICLRAVPRGWESFLGTDDADSKHDLANKTKFSDKATGL